MNINHLNKKNILRLIRACSSVKIFEKAYETLELGIHGKVITKINYNFSSSPKKMFLTISFVIFGMFFRRAANSTRNP